MSEWRKLYNKDSNTTTRPGDYRVSENMEFKLNNCHLPNDLQIDYKKKINAINRLNSKSYQVKHRCKSPREMLDHMIKNNKTS